MSRGSHAAGDGSFGRSASTAGLRGLALLAIAVAIGVVLLNRAGTPPTGLSAAGASSPTTAKPAKGHGTTTTAPSPSTTAGPTLRSPQDVKVLVANSTSVKDQAKRYTTVTHSFGYNTLPPVQATVLNRATSTIYYQSGFNGEAAVLATKLGLPKSAVLPMPATPPVAILGQANVLVIVGLDLANATTTPGGTQGTTQATTATTVRQAPATTAPVRTTTTAHP